MNPDVLRSAYDEGRPDHHQGKPGPVLMLWAAVVAERVEHPADTALSLASDMAGTAARAKVRRIGIADEKTTRSTGPTQERRSVAHKIGLTHDADRGVLAAGGGNAAPASAYVTRAFGKRIAGVRKSMKALAASSQFNDGAAGYTDRSTS